MNLELKFELKWSFNVKVHVEFEVNYLVSGTLLPVHRKTMSETVTELSSKGKFVPKKHRVQF